MLSICATPIGNLDDVTLRVLAELREAELVLAEDTRHTRILLERHGLRPKLLSFHQHNEAARVAELLPRLIAGARIALVSDAGMPLVSDPGARLVRAAIDAGVEVTVLPGPSAVEAALVLSGRAEGEYGFAGFLPRRSGELASLWREVVARSYPTVAFESPQRLPATLRALADVDGDVPVAVCRELTKHFEEVVRGTAGEVAERFTEPPRGEITLVVGPGGTEPDREAAQVAVTELVAAGTPRRVAADVVSRLTGVARNALYRDTL
jgi:16S rRNA (cytidine1402-2'-O)-methyltransferase